MAGSYEYLQKIRISANLISLVDQFGFTLLYWVDRLKVWLVVRVILGL